MKLLKLLVLTVALASFAAAMPIVGLYSTGLGAAGGTEPNWQLNGGTAYITQDGQFPIGPWAANTADSKWISPSASYVGAGGALLPGEPSGVYTYTLSFDLTGYDPTTAAFSYRIGGDNRVQSVFLNSTSIPGAGSGLSSLSGPFNVAAGAGSGFTSGVNTITVEIFNNSGEPINPSGFRLEVLESDVLEAANPVPEPATFALVGLALAAIPALRRRRSS